MMIGARDPIGIRPLVLGERDGAAILASETCALDMIGAKFVRSIEPGEVVVITRGKDGNAHISSHFPFPNRKARPCIVRVRLFLAPGLHDRRTQRLRHSQAHGPRLAKKPASKPTSSCRCRIPACRQRWASPPKSGIPYELGIIRNHYVGRTFIQPKQEIRALGVRLKHSANRDVHQGQARRAGRRFHRARHHVAQDRADGARSRRQGSSLPQRLAADQAPGLLRHRHAEPRPS
jgi:amidophosphoribosyltransferase